MKCPYCKSLRVNKIHETNAVCNSCHQVILINKKGRPERVKDNMKKEIK